MTRRRAQGTDPRRTEPARHRLRALVVLLGVVVLVLAACGAEEEPDAAAPEDDQEAGADDQEGGEGEPEPVTISFVSSWEEDSDELAGFWQFAERLEEEAPWIELDYRGGPETFPPDQQGEAVGDGAVDAAVTAGTYYTQNVPLAHAMKLTPFLPEEERERGIYDVYEEHHNRDLNAHYLGKTKANTPFFLYLNEEIDSADLSGLRIRTSPVYVALVEALGGSAVSMDPGEVYTALERGVVDGFGWPATGVTDRGWQEVTAYELRPGFYELDVGVIVNLDFWDGLEEETRTALTEAMQETEREIVDLYEQALEEEVAARQEAGMEVLELPDDEAEAFVETAYEAGWEDALEQAPEAEQLRDEFEEGRQAED